MSGEPSDSLFCGLFKDDDSSDDDDAPSRRFQLSGTDLSVRVYGIEYGGTTGLDLWPAAEVLARWILTGEASVAGESVLEISAGAGLPSLAASVSGAALVCASDQPDEWLLDNLRHNVSARGVRVEAYSWGESPERLLGACGVPGGFGVVLMCDAVYHGRFHDAQVESLQATLEGEKGRALVSYTTVNQTPEVARAFLKRAADAFSVREVHRDDAKQVVVVELARRASDGASS